jgi:hypothetical protein
MNFRDDSAALGQTHVHALTRDWGPRESVALYLDRCQIDTPTDVVRLVWKQVLARRPSIGKTVDFGAGDGRFSRTGQYRSYIGYEIDASRCASNKMPRNARMVNKCAFSDFINDADLCIGNPPYVRNQDLPSGWRERVATILQERTNVNISGLANAWLYFFLLSLASTKADGLVALVIPFEWVSRPSSNALRQYIHGKQWSVSVYRLLDDTFSRVLTTSSITIIDKRAANGEWEYYEQTTRNAFKRLNSPSGGKYGVLEYASGYRGDSRPDIFAKRGLSPGTQDYLTLNEGERVRSGLHIDTDVVPCVTSLRLIAAETIRLDDSVFKKQFVNAGRKCWLIRTDREPSKRLQAYLDSVPKSGRKSSTCTEREDWWRFKMPSTPSLLMATGFRDARPKVVVNAAGAHAVGGVCGVYCKPGKTASNVARALRSAKYIRRVVPHSNGLRKLEINQINSLLKRFRST